MALLYRKYCTVILVPQLFINKKIVVTTVIILERHYIYCYKKYFRHEKDFIYRCIISICLGMFS